MRNINEATLVSLDGVIGNPGAWASPFIDDELQRAFLERLLKSDALLMGRHTYELFLNVWPGRTGDYPERINNMQKYVFSSTLGKAEWDNTTVIRGDVVEELRKLKDRDGGDLTIYGHGMLGRTALKAGLLDELLFSFFPVVVGEGERIRELGGEAGLSFAGAKVFDNGVVAITLHPIPRYLSA